MGNVCQKLTAALFRMLLCVGLVMASMPISARMTVVQEQEVLQEHSERHQREQLQRERRLAERELPSSPLFRLAVTTSHPGACSSSQDRWNLVRTELESRNGIGAPLRL